MINILVDFRNRCVIFVYADGGEVRYYGEEATSILKTRMAKAVV